MDPFTTWLASLDPDALAALLRQRPELVRQQAPADLDELAALLSEPSSLSTAIVDLDLLGLMVVQALVVLGPVVERAALDDAVAGTLSGADVETALDGLSARALAWREGPALRLAPGVADMFDLPLGLGRPARELYEKLSPQQLLTALRGFGARPRQSKAERAEQLAALVGDREKLLMLLAGAPEDSREELADAVGEGRRIASMYMYYPGSGLPAADPLHWLTAHGLAVMDRYEAEVPREVALALREKLLPSIDPRPPQVATTAVGEEVGARAAGERASALLAAVHAVAGEVDATPPAMLKAGGIGVRELRRLAAGAGVDADELRRVLALLAAANLAAPGTDHVLLTAAYDSWAQLPPGAAWVSLARAWLMLPGPLVDPDSAPPLSDTDLERMVGFGRSRRDVLSAVGELPGAGAADLGEWMRWRSPLVNTVELGALVGVVAEVLGEAEWMGLVGAGALAPAGRALLGGEVGTAAGTVSAYLPAQQATATLQADLTALVAGPPTPALATLLDQMAERIGRDAAHTWRFTPASVRRALDAGGRAADLLAALAGVAGHGVPQPLEQLFTDVARRHGRLRVGGSASWVRSDDAPLIAEVVRDKKLAALKLRTLAPTVLASARPAGETVKALQAAGYAPVAENRSGEVVVARPERRRAAHGLFEGKSLHPPGVPPAGHAEAAAKLAAGLAGKLPRPGSRRSPRTRADGTTRRPAAKPFTGFPGPEPDDEAFDAVMELVFGGDEVQFPDQRSMAEHVPGLSQMQRQVLAAHIGTRTPVLVEYREGAKARRELVVDPMWQPPMLIGSSPHADGVLAIPLSHIVRVHG